jgi:hypothetical protein
LELADHPGEVAGVVGVGGVYVIQIVGAVPEVSVEGDDS